MKLQSRWAAALLSVVCACASARGIDRPMTLDPAYAAREAGARKPADRCGPEFISDNLPVSVVSLMGPLLDGPFRPVCARHDACYELREQSQAWCDARMRAEMMDICNAGRSDGSVGGALCRFRADIYAGMVDSAFGALAYEGDAGGEITALVFAEAPAGELNLCATVRNPTMLLQQYVVELRSLDGKRVDRNPRFRERSVRAGESGTFCVGTLRSAYWNTQRLTGPLEVRLLADRPDTLSMKTDRVIVGRQPVDLPN